MRTNIETHPETGSIHSTDHEFVARCIATIHALFGVTEIPAESYWEDKTVITLQDGNSLVIETTIGSEEEPVYSTSYGMTDANSSFPGLDIGEAISACLKGLPIAPYDFTAAMQALAAAQEPATPSPPPAAAPAQPATPASRLLAPQASAGASRPKLIIGAAATAALQAKQGAS